MASVQLPFTNRRGSTVWLYLFWGHGFPPGSPFPQKGGGALKTRQMHTSLAGRVLAVRFNLAFGCFWSVEWLGLRSQPTKSQKKLVASGYLKTHGPALTIGFQHATLNLRSPPTFPTTHRPRKPAARFSRHGPPLALARPALAPRRPAGRTAAGGASGPQNVHGDPRFSTPFWKTCAKKKQKTVFLKSPPPMRGPSGEIGRSAPPKVV